MKEKLNRIIFSENTALYSIIVGFSIFIVSLFIFSTKGDWIFSSSDNISEEKIAQYGDFIGGVIGSLFSLVGVILFYVALRDQRSDFATSQSTLNVQVNAFQQQVKEFEAQREELEETRKIFEQQHKTMKNQQFDSNFYSLLNVFIQQRTLLDAGSENNYFVTKAKLLEDSINEELDFKKRYEKLCDSYYEIYLSDRAKLALYFMTIYRLFIIIEDCDHLTKKERESYHKILRSLISKDELLLLYYNYHSQFGKKPLPIVLKYNFFKHLEVLSKIEFKKQHEISKECLAKANTFVDQIKTVIEKVVEEAKSIESDIDDLKHQISLEDGIFFEINVNLSSEIEIKLIVDTKINDILKYSPDNFADFIECILIDTLYYSKFEKFTDGDLTRTKEIASNNTAYKYKFNNQSQP